MLDDTEESYLTFKGRKFNLYGELIQRRTKWSDPSIENFEKRTKCLVKQFNQYKIGENLHVCMKFSMNFAYAVRMQKQIREINFRI